MTTNPSDAPCHTPRRPETRTAYGEPEPLPPIARQRERLSELRAPSIDGCSRDPLSRSRVCGNPPPIPGLATGESASDALSPPRCSRTKKLDPTPIHELFTRDRRGPRIARRLLQPNQSASTTYESTKPRPPNGRSPNRTALMAGGYAEPRMAPLSRRPLERGQPRRHGSGAIAKALAVTIAPHIAIARDVSLAPTQSARAPRCR